MIAFLVPPRYTGDMKKPCPCGKPSDQGRSLCKECECAKKRTKYASDDEYRERVLRRAKAQYNPEYTKKKYHLYRRKAFEVLGGYVCTLCGFDDPRALQIDHVADDGYQKRQDGELGERLYRLVIQTGGTGFQILCANCNWIKKAEREGRTLEYYWEEQEGDFKPKAERVKRDPELAYAPFATDESAGSIAARLHMSRSVLREMWYTKFGSDAVRERGRRIQAEAVRLTGLANKKDAP